MKRNLLFSSILLFSIFLFSCEGDTGPAGKDGVDGADGNANVKAQIFTITASEWEIADEDYETTFVVNKVSSIITQDIFDSGAVLCYMKVANNVYVPIPVQISEVIEEEDSAYLYRYNYFFTYSPGTISFFTQLIEPEPTETFKVIAIESNEVVSKVNTNNYHEVIAALGLQE